PPGRATPRRHGPTRRRPTTPRQDRRSSGRAIAREEIVMKKLSLLLVAVVAAPSRADNWPQWRGPTGQGLCAEKNLPLRWDATTNVKWKVALADEGNSTPVVWGDKV